MAAAKDYVLAAGGLLEKGPAGTPLIAVVGRTRYARADEPMEWVLPKGKRQGDESIEQTALREVLEETGCAARIVGPSFEIEYLAGGLPKLVVFFRMQLQAEGAIRDASESKGLQWLPPREAAELLTHAAERDVVRQAYPQTREEGR